MYFLKEKSSLQNKFTLLKSKFFPAKISFSRIKKKKFGGKNLTLLEIISEA
jgi:hypothetical protein